MVDADLDDVRAVLAAPDPVRPDRRQRTRADAEHWVRWTRQNYAEHGFGLWVIETHEGRFVGDCGLTMQDVEGEQMVEVGYHVHLDLRGQGLATEAAAAVRDTARDVGVAHLVAIIRPENIPSQRVADKVGLRLERRSSRTAARRSCSAPTSSPTRRSSVGQVPHVDGLPGFERGDVRREVDQAVGAGEPPQEPRPGRTPRLDRPGGGIEAAASELALARRGGDCLGESGPHDASVRPRVSVRRAQGGSHEDLERHE